MIAAIAIGLALVTRPFDTGWQFAVPDAASEQPTYSHVVQPCPLGTTDVRLCLTIEGRMPVSIVNRSAHPFWGMIAVANRTPQFVDRGGFYPFWIRTAGGLGIIPKENAIQPGEHRSIMVEWSTGPVCEAMEDDQAWVAGSGSPGLLRYGCFRNYEPPLVVQYNGAWVPSEQFYRFERAMGLEVYVDQYGHVSRGRLVGVVECR